jgi:hypothetical protein
MSWNNKEEIKNSGCYKSDTNHGREIMSFVSYSKNNPVKHNYLHYKSVLFSQKNSLHVSTNKSSTGEAVTETYKEREN